MDRWLQDGIFQLQRRAHEAQGSGTWENLSEEVPVTMEEAAGSPTSILSDQNEEQNSLTDQMYERNPARHLAQEIHCHLMQDLIKSRLTYWCEFLLRGSIFTIGFPKYPASIMVELVERARFKGSTWTIFHNPHHAF